MRSIRWQGREIGPATLIAAAREARRHSWLDGEDRRFLHAAGLALAGDRPLGAPESLRLDLVLQALQRMGWQPGPGADAAEAGPAVAPPAPPADDAALAELRAEVGRLSLLLASANERLEACREWIERRQRGLPPEDGPQRRDAE